MNMPLNTGGLSSQTAIKTISAGDYFAEYRKKLYTQIENAKSKDDQNMVNTLHCAMSFPNKVCELLRSNPQLSHQDQKYLDEVLHESFVRVGSPTNTYSEATLAMGVAGWIDGL